jgi:serine/threonine protein phosphatase 1
MPTDEAQGYAIIGDVHGCLKTLQALVAKLPADDVIVLVGDLIDRGPDSVGVLDWVMAQQAADPERWIVLYGNHEDIMVAHYETAAAYHNYGWPCWLGNGGDDTLPYTDAHRAWIKQLPHTVRVEPAHDGARALVVSHGCYAPGQTKFQRIWSRGPDYYDPSIFYVFGHTPQKEVEITRQWANVDTGCVHRYTGITPWGKLSALRWPSMEVVSEEFCG